MFPRFDADADRDADRQGHERLARCRRRQGGLRLRHRRRVGRARRGRDPGPPGDQPRRPAGHGRRPRHPHQPRRQDLARGGRGPRHGPHLRVRRRRARRSTPKGSRCDHARRRRGRRGRRRSPSTARPARSSPARCRWSTRWWCATSRATTTRDGRRAGRRGRPAHGARRRGAPARVRANADTPDDAARARRFGAQGIGLCRTEHMFLGDRKALVENLILAESEEEQEKALAELLPLQRDDFVGDPRGDGRPAGDDPADRPAAARVPARLHRPRRSRWRCTTSAATRDTKEHKLLDAVKRLHEENPMLGPARRPARHRDPRPVRDAGPGDPGGGGACASKAGGDPHPEIMIPLVATVQELELVRADIDRGGAAIEAEHRRRAATTRSAR